MGKKSIIILAAGAGTRMKSDTPKVLHKISGKPMLYYSIKEALKLSDDITVVLYHQFEKVKAEIEKYFSNINFVIQDHKKYPGTGGAVMGITPKYEKVLVLNGDMPLIQANELEKFEINATIVMSVLELESADGYGRVIIENGNVKKIVEQKDASEDELKITTANAGIYQFETKFLLENLPKLDNNNAQKEYYITDLVEMAISQGKVLKPLVVNEENFKGVNSKVELADAEVIHQNRIKKEFMKAGVIMRLPDTIYIEEGVEIEGESIIENGVSLLGNAKIINSHIKTNSVVEDSIVKDSDVGPMGRVRPGSELTNTHIGNFVETKKAKLTGVKAGHLSYLGDCSIDEGTNIGCGTITCNYDGINKHQTIIGKNVFVGSDTQFVAPVNIEDDVLIGAGSTVTGNVKKGELYLTRAKAKTIDGFFYKHFSSKKK
ncbi:bifunctional UDP-N-acetylglucosamine diphosphorylase/glucosamine-1-phosphate N-acetyltransferase GlmU [Aliarcobacter butzleri]|uniref:bifunctional UDP-N-acetylglucosamine diphosphorylase/glucosamine-1-phosphate N-acetyltransferase GlmU n=1 Tax=Aliarcobacter butzleri TaxID=28197 RepID=UPI00063AC359|nr:bifunctional UDP-N-acetylglucosamine diphosphorylase/glucosamine-1-phosphate N-acetyltransferase GlmU [Aliarcobacter butzleri]KLE10804.1 N-acetylglucosamine-1-phosphate uridyltransferase [Aliarcobacter butzleri L354]MDN5072813.1 bifunctional UDP-N-acetylglucosamine diphosphorylase/glucosamine-1-phosphate N-acetyltransferase GlmU [Aliarcobacter butzleri]MDN5121745.1 bifunctional UDP-N-acetylglucosamine diphosphorylase/glucosamine-1-phosphate N-acetyltransferase GlmU [Aliarcobacter butzleri]MD